MSLIYTYNKKVIQIEETKNESDFEFDIKFIEDKYMAGMKQIQKGFEENKVYTDVLFYPYDSHHYRIIVRQDYYVDFVLALLKHQLLVSVEWS
ncbi:hypothetical protein [Paenibacillus spongiae]|uniref:Phage protein n=1 Tax=Paenibacillus spongiae TaxID=2909671 RepID=A0ABY5SGY1_9BACL|nr:hypothetical protein [Paenibacillus spongiae]UVI33227.1 hypothetical protein L1F29_15885 [Paenibacillus spongiae]